MPDVGLASAEDSVPTGVFGMGTRGNRGNTVNTERNGMCAMRVLTSAENSVPTSVFGM